MITFDLTQNKKQQEFWNHFWAAIAGSNDFRYFFYGGAVRGGKTSLILTILYFLARKYNNSRWHILRESYTDLEDTTIPSWDKFYSDSKHVATTIRSRNNYHINFINGSKIFFKSESFVQDPLLSWMDGLETNGIFLEQMEGLSEKCFNKSLERIGSWYIEDMPPALLFGSFNPTQQWVKHKIYEPFKKGTLNKRYCFVEALPTDNPFVTGEQWEAWANMDSLSYSQRIQGNWDAFAAANSWAYAFNETKHTGSLVANYSEPFYISFDFNHSPVTCTIWQHYDNRIRCLTEFGTNEGISSLCEKIRNYIGWHNEELEYICYVTGDMSGWARSALLEGNRHAYDEITDGLGLTKYQIQSPKSNPNLLKSRELVNSVLEKHPDFLIDKTHCPNLIFDLKFCESDEKHQIVKDRNRKEGKADFLDSMRYFLNTYHNDFVKV